MKKITTIILALLFGIYSRAQTTQTFIKNFETGSGIYGYVEILTMPATYGFASLKIQAKSIVIKGVRINNENITSSTLSNYGVTFPFNCNNCYFYASGTASMFIGYSPEAKFRTSGSIHLRDFTSHTVNFSQVVKDKHNLLVKNGEGSKWETTGYVDHISISGVSGGDFGIITRAVQKYAKTNERKENYNKYIGKAERTDNNQEKLQYLNQARQYAEDTSNVDYKIAAINTKLEKEKQEANLSQQDDTNGDGIVIQENSSSSDNSSEKYNSSSSSSKRINSSNSSNQNSTYKPAITSQELRNEANSMVVQYRFQQEFKNKLLADAKRLEEIENIGRQPVISSGTDSNSSYSSSPSSNSTNNYIQSQQFRNDVQVLANSINQLFYVDPVRQAARDKNRKAREKYRNELNRHKTNRKMADSDVINLKESGNLKIKKKKNFYGVIDSNNNWIIKPKYLAIKLKKEEEGKKIFWLKKKNLTIDYITIKTQ